MYAQRLKVGTAAVLVVLVAVMGAAVGVATAQCAFTLTATPSSAAPDASVLLEAKCLHDAFGNKISGATVTFDVTKPDGSAAPAQTATTNANGDASTTYTGTSQYGSYSAKASSGAAIASASFSVAPGAPAGTFSLSAPASPAAGSDLTLTASGIKDANGKPVANGTAVSFKLTRPDASIKTYPGTTSGVDDSADTATATATVPGADVQKAGTYSASATAGAASSDADAATPGSQPTTFTIDAGALASLIATAPASLVVGDPVGGSFGAKDAKDKFGNPVGDAAIALHVEDPLVGDTTGDANGNCTTDATGTCSAPHAATAPDQPYGEYTLGASSGGVSDSKKFQVQPGPAATIDSIAASPNNPQAGTSTTISVNGIKSALNAAAKNGTVVNLSVTGPSGTKSYSGTVSGVDSRADTAGVSITIPGADNTKAGTYAVHATADGAMADTTYTVVAGPPMPDMTLSAPDVTLGKGTKVTVGNIPDAARSVELIVTRPNGSTFSKTVNSPVVCDQLGQNCLPGSFGGSTTIDLTAADLNQTGTYGMSAVAKDANGSPIAGGSGSFKVNAAPPPPVVGPEPTTIVVTTSPSGTINPTQQVFITATATGATGPSFNRTLVFEVRNALGMLVFSGARVTDSQGKATVSVGGPFSLQQRAQTALPGKYDIAVRYVPTGNTGTGSFNVLI